MSDYKAVLVALVVGGGGAFFYQAQEIDRLNGIVDRFQNDTTISYGALSAVNRVELVTSSLSLKCELEDDAGPGKGIINYFWSFEFAYGVEIPSSYSWNIKDLENGIAEVELPSLKQLRPYKVEFSDFIETNQANGDRWERMYLTAKAVGRDWLIYGSDEKLKNDQKVWVESKASMERLLLPVINDVRKKSLKAPFSALKIRFENEPESLKANNIIPFPNQCKSLI